jgi:hypothetical protein
MVLVDPGDADVGLQASAFGEALPREFHVSGETRCCGERAPSSAEVGAELDGPPRSAVTASS